MNSWLFFPSSTLRATTHSPILSSFESYMSRIMPASLSMMVTESFPPSMSAALMCLLIMMDSSHKGVTVFFLTLERTPTSIN